jgi:hypothetical protein
VIGGTVSATVIALTQGVMKAMLLSKIKTLAVGVLVVTIGAGGLGLTYRSASAQVVDDPRNVASSYSPGATVPQTRRARDELEELRLEIEALRHGLQVTRAQVKALQGEVEELKTRARSHPRNTGMGTPSTSPNNAPASGKMGGAADTFDRLSDQGASRTQGVGNNSPANRQFSEAKSANYSSWQGGAEKTSESPDVATANPTQQWSSESPENAFNLALQQQRPLVDEVTRAEAALRRLREHPEDQQTAKDLQQWLGDLKKRIRLGREAQIAPNNAVGQGMQPAFGLPANQGQPGKGGGMGPARR